MSETETTKEKFDPSKYLSKVGGSDYLEVKWRAVWFREENPNGSIVTELVYHDFNRDDPLVIFKATATSELGGVATGYGSEEASDFGDYIEKAETKAIGRALAALGYGTQFCDDLDFGGSQGRVVDSPIGGGYRSAPLPTPPPPNDEGVWRCENCDTEIRAGSRSKYTTEQLVSLSLKRSGKILCYTCSQAGRKTT